MILTMPLFHLLVLFALSGDPQAPEIDQNIPLIGPGHQLLDTSNLQFPRAVYYARAKSGDGPWNTQGTLTEWGKEIEKDGKKVVARHQVVTFANGKNFIAHTTEMETSGLMPLGSTRETDLPQYPPGFVKWFQLEYKAGKLQGQWHKEGQDQEAFPAITLKSAMFEGDVLGVVLAALPLKKGFRARLPVMYSQMSIPYTVVARVVGHQDFKTVTGATVRAWAVETDWHDLKSGEVSPGGGSGGTYYVVPKPPPGYPHVPKYINDSFDTELVPVLSLSNGQPKP